MRLGLSSYTYSWSVGVPGKEPPEPMDSMGLLNEAARYGIKCIQIADNLPLHILTEDQRNILKKKANDQGITIEVGTRGIQPENIEVYLDIANFFDSPILRVVIDAADFTPNMAEINSIISDFIPELKDRKIKLAIENHDRLKAMEFENIIETAGSDWVGICLDTVNSMGAGEGLEEVFRILGPHTINFHIKDFIVKRIWHMMGFEVEGLPAGKGMLPVKNLIERLDRWGRCQSGILELWTPQQMNIEATIRMEKLWAMESIEFLKTILDN
jgi:sugar phosphate isomerase/epimerase